MRIIGDICQLPAIFCSHDELNFGVASANEPLKLCRISWLQFPRVCLRLVMSGTVALAMVKGCAALSMQCDHV